MESGFIFSWNIVCRAVNKSLGVADRKAREKAEKASAVRLGEKYANSKSSTMQSLMYREKAVRSPMVKDSKSPTHRRHVMKCQKRNREKILLNFRVVPVGYRGYEGTRERPLSKNMLGTVPSCPVLSRAR